MSSACAANGSVGRPAEAAAVAQGSSLSRDFAMAHSIASAVDDLGGRTFFVGGCVRDRLMGWAPKDLDIEVHGVSPSQLKQLLSGFGHCSERGAGFGILALDGYGLDIAQPRRESATGLRHQDLDVVVDPFIGTRAAALRRDFTINALMEDVLTGEIVDHFGGREDLSRGMLRHVDSVTFAEDPLRVLRGAQFAARFGFEIAPLTRDLCRGVDLSFLSPERVLGELEKALLSAGHPSVFFEELASMDQLGVWFPELAALRGVPQPPEHHPEGDVWAHTMLVLDQAACLRDGASWPLAFMMSALAHDFGKASTTTERDGHLHAYGHEEAGVPVAHRFVRRLTRERKLAAYVENMVLLHMRPNALVARNSRARSFNHLFDESVAPSDLLLLAKADHLGRTGAAAGGYDEIERSLADRLVAFEQLMALPYVAGSDLIAAGLVPGPSFSQVLDYAHKLRLAGIPKDEALRQTLGFARSLK